MGGFAQTAQALVSLPVQRSQANNRRTLEELLYSRKINP
jgi:hypothetical protein